MVDLSLRLDIKQTQKLLMTPSLQQAIKLLQLSKLDLVQLVHQEITENPVLEEVTEVTQELSSNNKENGREEQEDPAPASADSEDHTSEIDWEEYFNDNTDLGLPSFRDPNLEPPVWENTLVKLPTIQDHLLWQLRFVDISPEEFKIGEELIGNIDDDGYLRASLEEIVQITKSAPERVKNVLSLIQSFEPTGVGASDLKECLLLQVRAKGEDALLQARIIEDHLNDLENKKYPAIASALKIPLGKVVKLAQAISSYDPRPGRRFSARETRYVLPDVYVYKVDGEYVVIVNDEGIPRLKISNFYKQIIRQKSMRKGNAHKYVEEKMRSAVWLIKSIQQRQMTLYKVTESIVKFQRSFLDEGINKLRPLTLKDVAEDISVHESTVSRVTTNKYVHTPRGIFELKYFFHSGLERTNGQAVSSLCVKQMIKELVDDEDKHCPLTDTKILSMLASRNIHISRRTITKYREALNILPSKQRRQY